MIDRWIVTFYSTHFALKAEKVLKEKNLEVSLIPVPRSLSSNCGISLSFDGKDYELVGRLLAENGVEVEKIHKPLD